MGSRGENGRQLRAVDTAHRMGHYIVNFIRELSRTPRGDFIFVLAYGATVTSSEGHRDGVREHLNGVKLGTG